MMRGKAGEARAAAQLIDTKVETLRSQTYVSAW